MIKTTRKELLKQEDAFLSAAVAGADWVKTNRRQLTMITVFLVLCVSGIWTGVRYVEARNDEASRLLTAALKIHDAEVVAEGANPAGDPPTFASAQDKWRAARDAFVQLTTARSASSSPVARLAHLYIADLSERLGEAPKALEEYQALRTSLAPDHPLYFMVAERLAYLHEAQGDVAAALGVWGELRQRGGFYADTAAYQVARLTLAQGKLDEARVMLQAFAEDYPESSLRQRVQDQLALLGASSKPVAAVAAEAAAQAAED